jgi:Lrp/AsnC family transcriptional regulator for asnA, asnC and gidA
VSRATGGAEPGGTAAGRSAADGRFTAGRPAGARRTAAGAATGLPAPAVRQRVRRLRDECVVQIVGVTDPMAPGLPVMPLIGVRVDSDVHIVADRIHEL